MATAAELIAYLQALPPETEVSVLRTYWCEYDIDVGFTDLDLGEHCDVLDFRNNPRSPYFGKVYLHLGSRG